MSVSLTFLASALHPCFSLTNTTNQQYDQINLSSYLNKCFFLTMRNEMQRLLIGLVYYSKFTLHDKMIGTQYFRVRSACATNKRHEIIDI
jgi:hypothetical protein